MLYPKLKKYKSENYELKNLRKLNLKIFGIIIS